MSNPEQLGFPNATRALQELERATLINSLALDCKARLQHAMTAIDQVINASTVGINQAVHAIKVFAEVPGALGVESSASLQADLASTSNTLSDLERDVAEIVAKAGGLP